MSKARIYELAKELNTTSKRLMEKLSEINIEVKNHMSLLEEHELDALFKHIGVIRHNDNKTVDNDEKRTAAHAPPKADAKKDGKSAPRIIRKTEINLDARRDDRNVQSNARFDTPRAENRNNANTSQGGSYVRPATSTSGLRPGYVRDTGIDFKKDTKPYTKQENRHAPARETDRPAVKPEEKPVLGVESPKAVESKAVVEMDLKPVEKEPMIELSVQTEEKTHKKEEKVKEKQPKEPGQQRTVEAAPPPERVQEPKAPTATPETTAAANNSTVAREPKPAAEQGEGGKERTEQPAAEVARQNDRPQGQGRPYGDRPYGDRPQGQGNRPYGDRPQGQGNRPYGDRPQGQGNRPYGDRPQGQGNRPYGDRPQGQGRPYGDRPYGDRPQGQDSRPYGDRPQGQGNRPYGDRPQGQDSRPYGDRPQGQGNRPYGDRPQGQGNRPYGDRPQGQGNRPYGDRPQGQGNRPYGDRPQGQGNRPYGDRPQGQGRPYGDRPQGQGNRPYGDRPQGQGNRPYGDRPQGGYGRPAQRPLDIPKPELTAAQKEEVSSQRGEVRREFQNKDVEKDIKRDQKREVSKTSAQGKDNKRFKPQSAVVGLKKGVSEILDEEFILDEFYSEDDVKVKKGSRPRRGEKQLENRHIPHRAVLTSITIPESITVKDLAEALKKTSTDVIKKLMGMGMMATLNQEIDFDTATLIADEFGVKAEKQVVVNEEDILFDDEEDKEENVEPRPPVVVVMGHVDHGKTSLLDAIREANVIDTEAGGITQHIGAYMVSINDRNITFLDTPGHEAFTAMRARGAQVTDIAILVVAADDGVMPQTIEAINHAKAANVSIIVAINKIDKPGANPDRVKQELTEYGIVAEEWGGDAIMVPVSAKKRENIDQLLEMVLLAADMLELKSNPNKQAKGTIIEAKLDKARGPLATVLVQRGTLNIGDSIVTGTTVGRIRAMVDDKGHKVKKAGPSTPVEILGLPEVPEAGEIFYAITDEKVARQLADKRKLKQREQTLKASAKVSLEDLFTQIKEGKVKDLNIIVKADVQGSVEAVKQSLEKLSNDEVRVRIIHGGVGAITESDVTLAQVSNAIIIGFNVRPAANVAEIAQDSGVDLRLYRVIYNAIEDVQAAMKGMLEPTFKEAILGHAEIRQIFKVSGVGTIGGSYVTDGKITRNAEVRIVRNGIVVHEGKLESLKRFKDDAKEVAQGFECGLSIEKFNDIKEGDVVEAFVMEEVAR